jgi:hypothetical protein
MGYSHYWRQGDIAPGSWARLASDVASVVGYYDQMNPDHRLAGIDGNGTPEISDVRIALNGRQPDDDCESFVLTPAAEWSFCKTQWQPYDVVVCAVLLRATLTIPGFDIESDGAWGDAEWIKAREMYAVVFGEDPEQCPFRDTTDDEEMCPQCGHASDPHALIATTGDPSDGGIMLCPVVGCECFATWGIDGGPAKLVPDRAAIAALREQTQHQNER